LYGSGITARPAAVQHAVRIGGQPRTRRLAESVLRLMAGAGGIDESDDGNDGDRCGDCDNGTQDPRSLAQVPRVRFGLCLSFLGIA